MSRVDRVRRAAAVPATAAGIVLIFAVWAILARLIGASIVLPTPLETAVSLWSELRTTAFYAHAGATLVRAAAGFGIAFVVGVAWGLVAGAAGATASVLRPTLVLIRALPVIAVILLALIWFRSALAPIFVTLLMVLPLVVENVSAGARAASGELREMALLFRVPRSRRVRELTLPALRPYLFASAHAGLGMAFKVTVAAEVLVQPARALGGAMQEARFYLDTPRILALTVTVIALSAVAEAGLSLLERAMTGRIRWRPESNGDAGPVVPSPRAPEPIRVHGISRSYDGKEVFADLSLDIAPGEVTVILGPSGCGKTTLLRTIGGIDDPDAGRVAGVDRVSFVFQEPRLLPWADATANVGFVLPHTTPLHELEGWLERARLPGTAGAFPATLSGGMQQRLTLARAFAYPAQALLLDEPFQNLDLAVKLELAREVRSVTAAELRTTIMVTHDVVEALVTGDRIVILGGEPVRIIGEQSVGLTEHARDPRTEAHQAVASRLYELLLSAR